MPTTADTRARRSGSSISVRISRYPPYTTRLSAVVVRRASHTQYVPQVGLAHSIPPTMVTTVNSTPISALAIASRSQRR